MNKTERIAMRIAVKNDSQSISQIKQKIGQFLKKEESLLFDITQYLQRQINAGNYEQCNISEELGVIMKQIGLIEKKIK